MQIPAYPSEWREHSRLCVFIPHGLAQAPSHQVSGAQ